MSFVYAIYDLDELSHIVSEESSCREYVLGACEISRCFSYSLKEACRAAKALRDAGHRVYLQWDILMTESVFAATLYHFKDFDWSLFTAIRVQDPGALLWLKKNRPSSKLHLIVEAGNHNGVALNHWLKLGGLTVERLVLSPELSFDILVQLRSQIPDRVIFEVQALGRLLIFYTPRKLIEPLVHPEGKSHWRRASGTSEESPHKGFPLLENIHGTFMFNTKDLFILDEHENVQKLVANPGFSLRCDDSPLSFSELNRYFTDVSKGEADSLRKSYEAHRPVIKGFFRANKTDVLFKKLKNNRLQKRDDDLLGEVVEVKKKEHVVIHLKENCSINVGDHVKFFSPEGKTKEVVIKTMADGANRPIDHGRSGQIIIIPPVGGVSVRTQIFKMMN